MRSILPAIFALVLAAPPCFSKDKPLLTCEILSRRDGSGEIHQLYVRNTAGENLVLAAFVSNPKRLAPWKPTDTYDTPYILSGTPEYSLIFTGEILKASGRSKEIGAQPIRKIIEAGNWDTSHVVVLKPGEVLSAKAGVTGEPPTKVTMTFFRLIDGKFLPTPVNWTSPDNP